MSKIWIIPLILFFCSCEDYLEEDNRSFRDTKQYYRTEEGLESLISTCYATSQIWYAKQIGYDLSVAGTDIYDYGQQHEYKYQFTFEPDKISSLSVDPNITILWIELYKGINACNDAIEILSNAGETPFKENLTKIRLAEVRFLRAHYNWLLVEIWGGVELRTSPVKGVIQSSNRSSVEAFYEVIFEDLNFAVNTLAPSDNTDETVYGRVTHYAAKALRARIKLNRANQTTNQTLYSEALNDARDVINSNHYALYDNYSEVWNILNNSNNTEVIWAINYSRSMEESVASLRLNYQPYLRPFGNEYNDYFIDGNKGHLLFGMQYDVIPGMERDIANGRPLRRYYPTKYLIDAFNENKDERFYGSFKHVWYSNDSLPNENRYKWPIEGYAYHADTTDSLFEQPLFDIGDTAIYVTKDTFPEEIMIQENILSEYYHFNIERTYWCLDYNRMYNPDGTVNENGSNHRNMGFELRKFADTTLQSLSYEHATNSKRDAFVMRISEMYLIAAEALWRTGQEAQAYNNYLIPLANKRSYDGNGVALLASYDIHSGADLNMKYFLDERAREFCGEQLRWFDLKRMGDETFVSRIKKYAGNQDARENFDKHFILRPIPQAQLDLISNNEDFPQNPGYK